MAAFCHLQASQSAAVYSSEICMMFQRTMTLERRVSITAGLLFAETIGASSRVDAINFILKWDAHHLKGN